MTKKIAILTFDYEPFLYKTGNINETLIVPTDQLLNKMRNNRVVATFFIDTLFLHRILTDISHSSELWKNISSQIKKIHNAGHEIGLHLHPHWLGAKYQNMEWDLSDTSNYRVHSLSSEELDRLIKQSIEIVHNIVGENIWSKHISYRAGGWAIQPFSHLRNVFTKYNILVDSSVSMGAINNKKPFHYNFTNIQTQSPYRFSEDVCVKRDNGEFLEIPITSYSYNFFMKLISRVDKYLRSEIYQTCGKGISIQSLELYGINKMLKHIKTDTIMLSIDRMQPMLFKYLVTSISESNIVIISHPKDYSKSSGRCLNKLNNIKGLKYITISELK